MADRTCDHVSGGEKTKTIKGPQVEKLHALGYARERWRWREINPGEEQGPIGPRYKRAPKTMKVENQSVDRYLVDRCAMG